MLPEWELELLTDEEKKVTVKEPDVSERLAALEERVEKTGRPTQPISDATWVIRRESRGSSPCRMRIVVNRKSQD